MIIPLPLHFSDHHDISSLFKYSYLISNIYIFIWYINYSWCGIVFFKSWIVKKCQKFQFWSKRYLRIASDYDCSFEISSKRQYFLRSLSLMEQSVFSSFLFSSTCWIVVIFQEKKNPAQLLWKFLEG